MGRGRQFHRLNELEKSDFRRVEIKFAVAAPFLLKVDAIQCSIVVTTSLSVVGQLLAHKSDRGLRKEDSSRTIEFSPIVD